MKILIREKLSPHKFKTPEGYLICQDAILARTGKQTYRKNELFLDTDDDSEIEVDRPYDEVFAQETLASFENKPVTIEHPDEDVTVDNYKDYAVGFVRDIRQGKVDGEDVIIGNLVITDKEAIDKVESGEMVELSCGYDCDITDEDNPKQTHIRGNHLALCEQGRAGIAKIIDSKVKDDWNGMIPSKKIIFNYHNGIWTITNYQTNKAVDVDERKYGSLTQEKAIDIAINQLHLNDSVKDDNKIAGDPKLSKLYAQFDKADYNEAKEILEQIADYENMSNNKYKHLQQRLEAKKGKDSVKDAFKLPSNLDREVKQYCKKYKWVYAWVLRDIEDEYNHRISGETIEDSVNAVLVDGEDNPSRYREDVVDREWNEKQWKKENKSVDKIIKEIYGDMPEIYNLIHKGKADSVTDSEFDKALKLSEKDKHPSITYKKGSSPYWDKFAGNDPITLFYVDDGFESLNVWIKNEKTKKIEKVSKNAFESWFKINDSIKDGHVIKGNAYDVLDEYLKWEGIIGYTDEIYDHAKKGYDALDEYLEEEGIYGYTRKIMEIIKEKRAYISDATLGNRVRNNRNDNDWIYATVEQDVQRGKIKTKKEAWNRVSELENKKGVNYDGDIVDDLQRQGGYVLDSVKDSYVIKHKNKDGYLGRYNNIVPSWSNEIRKYDTEAEAKEDLEWIDSEWKETWKIVKTKDSVEDSKITDAENIIDYNYDFNEGATGWWVRFETDKGNVYDGEIKSLGKILPKWFDKQQAMLQVLSEKYKFKTPHKKILNSSEVAQANIKITKDSVKDSKKVYKVNGKYVSANNVVDAVRKHKNNG